MHDMVINSSAFKGFSGASVAGKTGTAQIVVTIPSHGLFVGFAGAESYEDPEIAIAVRIANGYSSANAAMAARDIISYYFGLMDESDLITGKAASVSSDITRND